MAKIPVNVKSDHLESLTTASPINALAELIWNGFDSGSNQVQVFLEFNDIGGVTAIRVRDYGEGIDNSLVNAQFGNLGDSWKKIVVTAKMAALFTAKMEKADLKLLH